MGLSGGGLYPNISYQATKGAIVNMTRALAVEWAPHAIRVNAVAPTYVRTDLIGPILKDPELIARIEAMGVRIVLNHKVENLLAEHLAGRVDEDALVGIEDDDICGRAER